MKYNFFQRRRILKKLNYMEATPFRTCESSIADDGNVTLLIPRFKNKKLNDFLFHPNRRYFKIHLDELGSVVWKHIDGSSNVASICSKVSEICGEKIMPAEQRITKFLTILYENRYISFREIEKKVQ